MPLCHLETCTGRYQRGFFKRGILLDALASLVYMALAIPFWAEYSYHSYLKKRTKYVHRILCEKRS